MAKKEKIGYKPIDNAYTRDIDAWFIIVLILFFFPIGVWLMWARTSWKKWIKIVVSIIVAIAFITSVMSSMQAASAAEAGDVESTGEAVSAEQKTHLIDLLYSLPPQSTAEPNLGLITEM